MRLFLIALWFHPTDGRDQKKLVARNVATATDYYKEAYLDGQIILLVNTYNGDTYEGM